VEPGSEERADQMNGPEPIGGLSRVWLERTFVGRVTDGRETPLPGPVGRDRPQPHAATAHIAAATIETTRRNERRIRLMVGRAGPYQIPRGQVKGDSRGGASDAFASPSDPCLCIIPFEHL